MDGAETMAALRKLIPIQAILAYTAACNAVNAFWFKNSMSDCRGDHEEEFQLSLFGSVLVVGLVFAEYQWYADGNVKRTWAKTFQLLFYNLVVVVLTQIVFLLASRIDLVVCIKTNGGLEEKPEQIQFFILFGALIFTLLMNGVRQRCLQDGCCWVRIRTVPCGLCIPTKLACFSSKKGESKSAQALLALKDLEAPEDLD